MPASACCSAITSGVAIRSVDLHSNHAVLDDHRKGVDGYVRRQVQGLPRAQVELRPVPGTFDHTVRLVQLAVHEFAVVVRAAILDGEDLTAAVDDADLEVLVFHEAFGSRRELFELADVDEGTHVRNTDSGGRDSIDRAAGYRAADGEETTGRRDHVRGPTGGTDPAPTRRRAAAARDGARNALRTRARAGRRGPDRAAAARLGVRARAVGAP